MSDKRLIKALSIREPWATAIAEGGKTIETRSWSTPYRGPLLICASKAFDEHALPVAAEGAGLPVEQVRAGLTPRLGKAIAIANLIDCRPMAPADEEAALCGCGPGLFAWVLTDVQPIPHFPVKGKLGLFDARLPGEGESHD